MKFSTHKFVFTYRAAALNQAQNLQQAPMPMSPQPGQTGRGASVVSEMSQIALSPIHLS